MSQNINPSTIKCTIHKDKVAIGHCKKCDSNLCNECIIVINGKKNCVHCYNISLINDYLEEKKKTKVECPECQALIEKESSFCSNCGYNLKLTKITNENKNIKTVLPETKPPQTISKQNAISTNSSDSSYTNNTKNYQGVIVFSIICLLGFFAAFHYFLKLFSEKGNYSDTWTSLLTIIQFSPILIIVLIVFWVLKKLKSKIALYLITGLIALFGALSVADYIEIKRINKLEATYQKSINHLANKELEATIFSFNNLLKLSPNFKNSKVLLDSAKHLYADTLLKKLIIDLQSHYYNNAIDKQKSILELTGKFQFPDSDKVPVSNNLINQARNYLLQRNNDMALKAITCYEKLFGYDESIHAIYFQIASNLQRKANDYYVINDLTKAITESKQSIAIYKHLNELDKNQNYDYQIQNAQQLIQFSEEKQIKDKELEERKRKEQAEIEKHRQEAEEKHRIALATSKMRIKRDEIEKITWYYDKTSPKYTNYNSFHLYFGKQEGFQPWLRLRIQYTAEDWLFINSFIIVAEDQRFERLLVNFERDNSSEIWEWYDEVPNNNDIEMIKAIINSEKATIRFIGEKYRHDRVISFAEKLALKNVLEAYQALGGIIP